MTDFFTAGAPVYQAAKKTDQSNGWGSDFRPTAPRRAVQWWIGNAASAAACTLFAAFVAALLWSAS